MKVKAILSAGRPVAEKIEAAEEVDVRCDETRRLTAAARRALEEAEARRAAAGSDAAPQEIGGRGGPDPARYGDWEKNGIASDF